MSSAETKFSNNKEKFTYFILLTFVPFIIYFYFLKWKTNSIHDDDLYMYKAYVSLQSSSEHMNASTAFGQFRPIRDLLFHWMLQLLPNNINAYYIINVIIQSINTVIFAFLLNIFLRSFVFSFLFSLILGLSRFSYYNLLMLFNGGILEGLAMTFFLLFLVTLVKSTLQNKEEGTKQRSWLLWSILFATLSMYTHERYIVLFPFLLMMIVFFPYYKKVNNRTKFYLALLIIASPVLNAVIKKVIYSQSFFTGTGGTSTQFSLADAVSSFFNALLSIFQINIGPEYLVGLQFFTLPFICKVLVLVIICVILATFGTYLYRAIISKVWKKETNDPYFFLFIFLPVLSLFCLIPAILQIRMELRWFQASLSILILMFVIALTRLQVRNIAGKYAVVSLVIISFLITNFYYLDKGAKNLYYSTAARIGDTFHEALKEGIIHSGKSKLYIWQKQRNIDRENEINWALVGGYFFVPYQKIAKELVFVDSLYQKSDTSLSYSFPNFNLNTDQIIFLDIQKDNETFKYSIVDLTERYYNDSLINFYGANIDRIISGNSIEYNQRRLAIKSNNFQQFSVSGFHDYENGIRWTNGKASIEFLGDYYVRDSIQFELATYMPPICKKIKPKLFVVDHQNNEYYAPLIKREGDVFKYSLKADRMINIKKVDIISDTINAAPDLRSLSFPFISLILQQ